MTECLPCARNPARKKQKVQERCQSSYGRGSRKNRWLKRFQGNGLLMDTVTLGVPLAHSLCLLWAVLKSHMGPGVLGWTCFYHILLWPGHDPKILGSGLSSLRWRGEGFIHRARFCLFLEHGAFLVSALWQEWGGTVLSGPVSSFVFLVHWLVVPSVPGKLCIVSTWWEREILGELLNKFQDLSGTGRDAIPLQIPLYHVIYVISSFVVCWKISRSASG